MNSKFGGKAMSICNDKHHDKPSSCRQLFVHVRESETPMRDVRNLLLEILLQYREIDKVGFSLGVLDKSASFTDEVSWCAILGKMDHKRDSLDKVSKQQLGYSVDHLGEIINNLNEKVISQIQHYRDKWMKQVILWDVLFFSLILGVIISSVYLSGVSVTTESVSEFIMQRPFFTVIATLSVIGVLTGVHFFIRRLVLNYLLDNIEDKLLPGMSMARALRRNARIRHSIFRPEPVGWNFSQRNRLKTITEKLADIREQLSLVLDNYPDQKAA